MTYRPKHLDPMPRRRRRASLAVALVTSFAALFASAPAGAIGPSEASFMDLVVTANDTNSVGRCSFAVKSVDFQDDTVRARIKNSARPATILQANDNAAVQVRCEVYATATAALLAVFERSVDSAYMTAKGITLTLPLVNDYTLCTYVTTTTKDGDTTTAAQCAN